MRKFIAFFIKYPIWSNAILIVTAMAGLLSLFTMHRSFFPELEPNRIYVNVAYPGASAEEIEKGITTRIEEALVGLEGIKETSSTSSENLSNINIEAYEGTDLNELLQDVKNAVDGINSMPAGAERPIVYAQKARGMGSLGGTVGFVSLHGPDDLEQLKIVADKIEQDMLSSKKLSQIEVIGYPPQIIAIDIRENDLLRYGISFEQISSIVRSSNLDISGGSIKSNKEELYIRSMSKSTDPDVIKEYVIRALPDGQLIRLKDVADVNFEFSDIPLKAYVNGERSITFVIKKLGSEDIKSISDYIKGYVSEFNNEGNGFEMQTLFMFSDMLDQRIDMLTSNLFLGLILVCIVLGFFLSLRLSLWVAFGIPFSMIGMFALGALYGMTINMISLFGMILVVGILVDDGIVIAENIYSHFERGKSPMKAALDGTMEVLSSVFTSVLTTIVAFGFLLFVGGDMAMMEEMAFSVIGCLIFSLIEAFLILPAHLSHKHTLEPSNNKGYKRIRAKINKGIDKVRNGYEKLVNRFTKWYRVTVFGPMIFIIVIIGLTISGIIKTAFYPHIPFDNVGIDIAFKPGDREDQTEDFLWYLDSIVSAYGNELIETFGDTIITYNSLNLGSTERIGERGSHCGNIRVSVKENNFISTLEISARLKEKINKDSLSKLEKFSIGGETPFGKDISLSLQSEDGEQLNLATKWLLVNIKALPDVKDINDNAGLGLREIHLTLKPKAFMLGLNESSILTQIRQGFFGQEIQRVIIGRDEVKLWTRYPLQDRNSIGDLEDLRIKIANGQEFPLNDLVDYEIKRGKVSIRHINGKQEVRVFGSLYNGELSSVINADIKREYLDRIQEYFPKVDYQIKGQAEKAADSAGRLGIAFGLGVFLILIILSLNFSSFYQARLIMMVIPVGIVSAILGHGIVGIPFSIFSFWGIIALVGILVNDAVVMLDQYNRNLKTGMNPEDAGVAAGKSRFRAIILTSLTTVVGLFPLIYLETSFQAQFLIPMAISVAYGVLFGTLILLFFFPPLLRYFADIRRARWWLWRGGPSAPSRIEVEPITKHINRVAEMGNIDDSDNQLKREDV
jgi:multidrug efflux pump subunit AcrB